MTIKSLCRFVVAVATAAFVSTMVPTQAEASAACAAAKNKVACGKHADCSWSGKACVAKAAAKTAKTAAKKDAAKPKGKASAKAAAKAPSKKVAEPKKVVPAPAPAEDNAAPAAEGDDSEILDEEAPAAEENF